MTFSSLNLIAPILDALIQEGYEKPTPIQEQSIPAALEGKDVLGTAQTGTGKTAAFSIPILQQLYQARRQGEHDRLIKALILTPTRELALQIDESMAAYGRNTGLKHAVVFGGVSQRPQTDALKRGIDILVATPGRLLDLMEQGYIQLNHIKHFVLDEADRMLDMGFIHDVRRIISKLPTDRQTLFFSATMPNEIVKLSDAILRNPVRVSVAPVSSTAERVVQKVFFVSKEDKRKLLLHLLKSDEYEIASALVFTRTKHGADRVVKDLVRAGVNAAAIHGNKSQGARQAALGNFKNGKVRVLVATDIAARGIDIEELPFVINYELPNISETYVHRIGRTGRAGNEGIALSFCDAEEIEYLDDIHKLIKQVIPAVFDHPYPLDTMALAPAPEQKKRGGPPTRRPGPPRRRR
jgi:ATP-dependent RNA helicase RhlE